MFQKELSSCFSCRFFNSGEFGKLLVLVGVCLPSQQGYIHQTKLVICQTSPSSISYMKNMTTIPSDTQITYKTTWLILSDLFHWQRWNKHKRYNMETLPNRVVGFCGTWFAWGSIHTQVTLALAYPCPFLLFIFVLICIVKNESCLHMLISLQHCTCMC